MAGSSTETGQRDDVGVVVVEDGGTMGRTMVRQLQDLEHEGKRVRVLDWLDHDAALGWNRWSEADVVFIDAYFSDRQRRDRAASLFAGLEVADMLARRYPSARVVAYSELARRPEVNIPFHEPSSVVGLYDLLGLVQHLRSSVWDEAPIGQVEPPTKQDHESLGVAVGARIVDALALMRSSDERWELIAQTSGFRKPAARVRDFVNDRVRPLLGIEVRQYRLSVSVLQRVTGLPARW